jgi:salicylate hydroxylase
MAGSRLDIIVVGGGIGGLTTALALRRRGHSVRVVESSSWLREAGAAVMVPPNATRVLEDLVSEIYLYRATSPGNPRLAASVALSMACLCLHHVMQGIDLAVDADGAQSRKWMCYPLAGESKSISFGDAGHGRAMPAMERMRRLNLLDKCWGVHRIALHTALREKCVAEDGTGDPVEIVLGSKVVSWNTSGSIELSDGSSLTADLVVAADGIRSRAHEAILGEQIPVQCNGQTTMRFMLRTEDIQRNPATAPILEDGPGCFAVYLIRGDRNLLLRFPCQNNKLQNFGAYKVTNSESLEGEQVQKWDLKERLDAFPPPIAALAGLVEGPIWDWKITDRAPLPSYQEDRLVLVGDAAREFQSSHLCLLLTDTDMS